METLISKQPLSNWEKLKNKNRNEEKLFRVKYLKIGLSTIIQKILLKSSAHRD